MPWFVPAAIALGSTAISTGAAYARQRAAQKAALDAQSQSMASGQMDKLQSEGELQLGKSLGEPDSQGAPTMGLGNGVGQLLDLVNKPSGSAGGAEGAGAALGALSGVASGVIGGATAPDVGAATTIDPSVMGAAGSIPTTPDITAGLNQVESIASPTTPAGVEDMSSSNNDMVDAFKGTPYGDGKFGPSSTGVDDSWQQLSKGITGQGAPSTWGSNDQANPATVGGDSWGRFGKMMAEKAGGAAINTATAYGVQAALRRKKAPYGSGGLKGFGGY